MSFSLFSKYICPVIPPFLCKYSSFNQPILPSCATFIINHRYCPIQMLSIVFPCWENQKVTNHKYFIQNMHCGTLINNRLLFTVVASPGWLDCTLHKYKTELFINPSHQRYSFRQINNRQLLKALCEKKKLIVTINFSFSHNVFYSNR